MSLLSLSGFSIGVVAPYLLYLVGQPIEAVREKVIVGACTGVPGLVLVHRVAIPSLQYFYDKTLYGANKTRESRGQRSFVVPSKVCKNVLFT